MINHIQKMHHYGEGDSTMTYDVMPDEGVGLFEKVKAEVDWQTMNHCGGPVPRLISVQGTISADGTQPLYRHPADEQPELVGWTPTVDLIRKELEKKLKQEFNHALVQMYPDGEAAISEHADKTLDIARGTSVVNFSLGRTRNMILRTKDRDTAGNRGRQVIPLHHNSVFTLGWKTNRKWLHGIRPDRRPESEKMHSEKIHDGERISLTFRTISTFLHSDGKVTGQGAPKEIPDDYDEKSEMERMLEAFGKENHRSDFNWDEWYGKGFAGINFKTLNRAQLVPAENPE